MSSATEYHARRAKRERLMSRIVAVGSIILCGAFLVALGPDIYAYLRQAWPANARYLLAFGAAVIGLILMFGGASMERGG